MHDGGRWLGENPAERYHPGRCRFGVHARRPAHLALLALIVPARVYAWVVAAAAGPFRPRGLVGGGGGCPSRGLLWVSPYGRPPEAFQPPAGLEHDRHVVW